MQAQPSQPLQELHDFGQRIWLDNITRELLTSGTLNRYIQDFSVTGLTSNPTIFEQAIKNSSAYDEDILTHSLSGKSGEELFFELALHDLTQAADFFRPIYNATEGIDGWVSLEVAPSLSNDTVGTIKAATQLYERAQRPNLFIKIPGTFAGLPAIEESIFSGVPVNVTLLFSTQQYMAAAGAYMRGIERRLEAGLNPNVASVASVFISRWDVAVKNKVASTLQNRLGIAIAQRTYIAYRDLLSSQRWQNLVRLGARPQRLLWASTGTKDPAVSDTLYVEALAATQTINTLPEKTLLAFADHGKINTPLSIDSKEAEQTITEFNSQGFNDEELATELQREGTKSFVQSWNALMTCIADKAVLPPTTPANRKY